MKPKLLVTDRFSIEAEAHLKAHFEVSRSEIHNPTKEELEGVKALIIRSRTKITKEFLETAPDLQLIVTSTSGYDHIDFEETIKRNIKVSYTPEANAQSTAELTILLMLSCAREINLTNQMMRNANWKRNEIKAFELSGKTLGIVGLGRVGSRVSKIANAMNMKVYAYDPYKEDEEFQKLNVLRLGYTEILRMCNVVTYHVPSTKETYQMLNRRLFEDSLPGMIVINASRGDVINEQDILYGLETGMIERAGLDVFVKEPLPKDSPLITHPKVVTTPHIGATTDEAFLASSIMAADRCIEYFTSKKLSDELPAQAPWWKYQFRRNS
ncbi:MAG: hydroxyacid dehydrogenase [Bdellovibrionota bacterium]